MSEEKLRPINESILISTFKLLFLINLIYLVAVRKLIKKDKVDDVITREIFVRDLIIIR